MLSKGKNIRVVMIVIIVGYHDLYYSTNKGEGKVQLKAASLPEGGNYCA